MRILHCIYDHPRNPWVGGGGSERVREIYRRLSDSVEATVLAGAYPGARPGVYDGVRYEFAGVPRPYAASRLTYGWAASARLRAGDYDAAVFDFSVYTPIRVPRHRPVGHVVHMPMGPRAEDRWGPLAGRGVRGLEARMLRSVRAVSTTSRWMADQLQPLIPDGVPIRLVGSGVSSDFFQVVRAEASWLLYYGRFDWFQKGLDLVLRAAVPLLAAHPHLELVLAGRGKDLQRARAEVSRHPHGSRIRILPDPGREQVLELMAGALLLLHPSRFEGFPVVPAEAMAAGVPVVATRVGAVPEIVRGSEEGLLIPPDDAEALTAAASALLQDAGVRQRISRGARAGAARLRWDRVAVDHLEFLREVARLGR